MKTCKNCEYGDDLSHYICEDECIDHSEWKPKIDLKVEKYECIRKLKRGISLDFDLDMKVLDRLELLIEKIIEYKEMVR